MSAFVSFDVDFNGRYFAIRRNQVNMSSVSSWPHRIILAYAKVKVVTVNSALMSSCMQFQCVDV